MVGDGALGCGLVLDRVLGRGLGLAGDPLGVGTRTRRGVGAVLGLAGLGLGLGKQASHAVALGPELGGLLAHVPLDEAALLDDAQLLLDALGRGGHVGHGDLEGVAGGGQPLLLVGEHLARVLGLDLGVREVRREFALLEAADLEHGRQHLAGLLEPPVPGVRDVVAPVLEGGVDALLGKGAVQRALGVDAGLAGLLAADEGHGQGAQRGGRRGAGLDRAGHVDGRDELPCVVEVAVGKAAGVVGAREGEQAAEAAGVAQDRERRVERAHARAERDGRLAGRGRLGDEGHELPAHEREVGLDVLEAVVKKRVARVPAEVVCGVDAEELHLAGVDQAREPVDHAGVVPAHERGVALGEDHHGPARLAVANDVEALLQVLALKGEPLGLHGRLILSRE